MWRHEQREDICGWERKQGALCDDVSVKRFTITLMRLKLKKFLHRDANFLVSSADSVVVWNYSDL